MPGDADETGLDAPVSTMAGIVPKDMFEILVNGVFAFAMTLVVKNNIQFLSGMPDNKGVFFATYIGNIINDGMMFIFLFIILAIFYICFFEMMRYTRIIDHITIGYAFAFLLSILFIPLSSLLYALSARPLPYGVIFHVNILIAGIMLFLLWRTHLSRVPALLLQGTGPGTIRNLGLRLILLPATAVVGLLLDGWAGTYSKIPVMVLYIIPVILFVLLSRETDRKSP